MELTTTLLRTLKGAPISVYLALILAQQPVSAEWVARTTGYTDKPVLSALKFLEENHLVTRNERYGWQSAAGVQQLPIMTPARTLDAQAEKSDLLEDSELFRVGIIPSPLASSSLTSKESREENLLATSNDPENFRVAQNLAECDRQKIHEPARSRMARQNGVTPELIRAHCKSCANRGQAIYRIEHGWPAPVAVSTETHQAADPEVEYPDDFDETAAAWWDALVDILRDRLPRIIFDTWVQADAQARQAGDALLVLASNPAIADVLTRHIGAAELNALAQTASGGMVKRIHFTSWKEYHENRN